MSEFNLTADELLFIYISLHAQTESGHPEFFMKWRINCNGDEMLPALYESLKAKSIIKKNYKPEVYNPDEIEWNNNFLKRYYKHAGELGEELYDAYPDTMWIHGKEVSLKNFSKRFQSFTDMYFFYSSQIAHNPQTHKEVLELLEWGKENNLVNFGIVEFILSNKWKEFKRMRDSGYTGSSIASTYDVYTDI